MILPGEERRFCISSSFEEVRKLAGFCRRACASLLSEMDSSAVELAIVEAATNIVEHGYENLSGMLLELCIKHLGNALEFSLIHQGDIFRPDSFESPDRDDHDINEVPESGRGYFLIKAIMDHIHIEKRDELNVFRLIKNISGKPIYSKSPTPLLSQKADYSKLVHEEMEVAEELHRKLMPDKLPKFEDLKIFAKSEAARLVGGDYLTFHKLDDNTLYFMICDAMGKGMSAAFFSVIAHTTFRGILQLMPEISPGELLTKANQIMSEDFDMFEMFMTALVGKIDTSDDSLSYASAGHCQPILFSEGTGFLLDTGDFMFGVNYKLNYKTFNVTFKPGDKLVAYTDGMTDITDSRGEIIGVEPLLYACTTEFKTNNISDALSKIFKEVKEFSGGKLQDDISVIGIERL